MATRLGLAAHHLAARGLGPQTQTRPGGKTLVAGKAAQVSARLADDHRRGGDDAAVDTFEYTSRDGRCAHDVLDMGSGFAPAFSLE